MSSAPPENGSRVWRMPEAVHVDVRGLDPPEPMVEILGLIDRGEVDSVLIAHLDREPIFLYPELDDRGWSHEVMEPACGEPDCAEAVHVRIVRLAS